MKNRLWVLLLLIQGSSGFCQTTFKAVVLSRGQLIMANGKSSSFGKHAGFGFVDEKNNTHAVLWDGTNSIQDLNPQGFESSWASGNFGESQVGGGIDSATGIGHALVWKGTPESVIDLNPPGSDSGATAIYGDYQVGAASSQPSGNAHAVIWKGSKESMVDLHPYKMRADGGGLEPIYRNTEAYCIKGHFQGGVARYNDNERSPIRAIMWRGTPGSHVELHPIKKNPSDNYPPYYLTVVNGIDFNGHAVGFGGVEIANQPNRDHALLWLGSAGNYVDLNPVDFFETVGNAISGNQQVGYGSRIKGQPTHALLWSGTAESLVDLHQYLPSGFQFSHAQGIDEFGNVIGIAGNAPNYETVVWIPILEGPTTYLKIAALGQSGGRIWLQLQGEAGELDRIQGSINFETWTDLSTRALAVLPQYFEARKDQNLQFFRTLKSGP